MTKEAKFSVKYDGYGLETNSMDVRDLGPALMSLGSVFDAANRVTNGNNQTVKLHVKAYSPGSFDISFVLQVAEGAKDLLVTDYSNAANNLMGLITGSAAFGGGIFWLIKKLKGKSPDKIGQPSEGFIEIEFETIKLNIPTKLLRLYQDGEVRKAAEKVIKPLENDGINQFEIIDETRSLIKITKDELPYFTCPTTEEEKVIETEHRAAYSIVSVTFKEDNKWRLFDGNNTVNVLMRDEVFLNKIENSEISFAKGDILICVIRTKQWRTNLGLKTEHEVIKIEEHQSALKQLLLF